MTAKDGNIIERGLSVKASHVLSFKSWELFVAVYLNKVLQELPKDERMKVLKQIYVYALMNPCIGQKYHTQVVQMNDKRSKCK